MYRLQIQVTHYVLIELDSECAWTNWLAIEPIKYKRNNEQKTFHPLRSFLGYNT